MRTNLEVFKRFSKRHCGLFVGFVIVAVLFIFAYWEPTQASFPSTDFLDSTVVINHLFAANVDFMDLDGTLPTLLGGLSANALVINDLDPSILAYRLFDPFTAVVLVDGLSRVAGFTAVYALVYFFSSSSPFGTYSASGAGIFFALLPYFPGVTPTICFTAVALLALLNVAVGRYQLPSYALLLLSTQAINFVLGGFVILTITLILTVAAFVFVKAALQRLLLASLTVAAGSLIWSIRGVVLLSEGFVSHRTSWSQPAYAWFSPSTWRAFWNSWTKVVTQGQIDFASGQHGIPILLLSVISGIAIHMAYVRRSVASELLVKQGRGILLVCLAIILVGCIYAMELSTLTQFGSALPVPIALHRIIVVYPVLWSMVVGLSTSLILGVIAKPWRKFALTIIIFLILMQGVAEHHGIRAKIETRLFQEEALSLEDYYAVDTFKHLARQVKKTPAEISVVSIGLDPMRAAFAGFSVYDGYFYNYPRQYKDNFRKVIAPELEGRNPQILQHFDEWGSKVYMYRASSNDTLSPQFDVCSLKDLGAQYVIAPTDLTLNNNYVLAGVSGELRIYRLQAVC